MEFDLIILRACLGSVLLKLIAHLLHLRIRGRGSMDVWRQKLLGYIVVLGALYLALDSPKSRGLAEVLRGGDPTKKSLRGKRPNATFRLRRRNNTLARVRFDQLEAEYEPRLLFATEYKSGRGMMTADEIEGVALSWLRGLVIELDDGSKKPLTYENVRRILKINAKIDSEEIITNGNKSFDMKRGREGYMDLQTESGNPYRLREEDVSDWQHVLSFRRQAIPLVSRDGSSRSNLPLGELSDFLDFVMKEQDFKVRHPIQGRFVTLTQRRLHEILAYESRLAVNLHGEWIPVSDELLDYLERRIDPSLNPNGGGATPQWLKRYDTKDPATGRPFLEFTTDGLVLLTPFMLHFERAR